MSTSSHLVRAAALALGIAATALTARAQAPAGAPIPVSVDNFVRAESDLYFGTIVLKDGGFGKLSFKRDVTPIEQQNVIRANRDTLYAVGVFDLDAGPVTVLLPEAGKRFMSMQLISEDSVYVAGDL